MILTAEQRAARAVKRKNKKIAQEYPLFAEQFAVTLEEQVKQIEKQDATNLIYFENLRKGELEAWERACAAKEKARLLLPPEKFKDYETRYQKIYGSRPGKYSEPEYVGYYAADWWNCALRENCK